MDRIPQITKDISTRFHPELDFERLRDWLSEVFAHYRETIELEPESMEEEVNEILVSIASTESEGEPARIGFLKPYGFDTRVDNKCAAKDN